MRCVRAPTWQRPAERASNTAARRVKRRKPESKIAGAFPGEASACLSADRVFKDDDAYAAPAECLNTLKPSGIPKRELILDRSMMMLRHNLSPPEGLCNGTRLLVRRVINDGLLEAEIATGRHVTLYEDIQIFQRRRRLHPAQPAVAR